MSELIHKSGYILITPAKNEELFIEKTLKSVTNQSLLPKKWIIVSDGSTDRTNEIVKEYCIRFNFIKLICLKAENRRNFASKVYAINHGFKNLEEKNYDFYGNLDADVSFEKDYYEHLIQKFHQYPKLGITGGKVYDFVNGSFSKQLSSLNSVAGPIQFFRRECWEDIGGYVASEVGLIDAIAEITARMRGWETKTFPEVKVLHHRSTGSEGRNIWRVAIRQGKTDYLLGYHPIWHTARSIQRITKKPMIFGSFLRSLNFMWQYIKREKRPVTKQFVKFIRAEEFKKIGNYFLRLNKI